MTIAPDSLTPPSSPSDPDLFGRDRELEAVYRALSIHRLVTITGSGGVGKTRLARAVVSASAASATTVCELAPVPNAGGVPGTIAEALGFPSLDAACVGLTGQDRLLLVDNAEHHLDAVAASISRLLADTAGLTILATSQEPLDVPGEQVMVLDPLAVPPGDDPVGALSSPAVRLFMARAQAAGAATVDADAVLTVAAICRQLDGLPLAIELAAARARSLTPQDILRHLDARFELLTRRRERGPARHRSLQAAIDWSVERLDPDHRRFFIRLAAFSGPFTIEAAQAVAAQTGDRLTDTIDRLDALVHRCLVNVAVQPGSSAYQLPESVRLYARRRLEETDEAEAHDERCVDHHVELAAEMAGLATRSWPIELFVRLQSSQLNLQEAIRWCLERDADPQRGFTLFVPLWGVVHNGRAEPVRDLGEQLLRRWPDPHHPGWAAVAATTATAAIVAGRPDRGNELAVNVLRAPGGGLGEVIAARAGYLAAAHLDDHRAALQRLDRGLAAADALGLDPFTIELQIFLALAQTRAGNVPAAIAQAAKAQELARTSDSPVLQVFASLTVAALTASDDVERARAALAEALVLAQRNAYPWGIGMSHRLLGALAVIHGEPALAGHHLQRSMQLFIDVGQLGEARGTLLWVGALFAATGRVDLAGDVCPQQPVWSPVLDVFERQHLPRLLVDVVPRSSGEDLRPALIAARAILTEVAATSTRPATAGPRSVPSQPDASVATWRHEGDIWALTYDGITVRLADVKGLADLATLLSHAGREFAVADLMGSSVDSVDLGPTIDATARRAYERRIIELQQDLDEAERRGDLGRAEVAKAEFDQLVDTLTAATGLAGRSRRPGDPVEKARSAVTRRIRDAIRRIAEVHPTLGAHLSGSIRTGRWCAYEPAEPIRWAVQSTSDAAQRQPS
jgi:predicted ATPase